VGLPFLPIDAGLNLIWAVVSLGVLLCWRADWNQESRRALVAILCVLVLLFPTISVADDVAEIALMYDGAPSSPTLKSGKEIKQVIVPAAQTWQTAPGPLAGLVDAIGDGLPSDSTRGDISLLLTSSSGIHSPPQS
jgi:hypothetical protein